MDPDLKETDQIEEVEYAGPISRATRRIKRYLLFVSFLVIVLKVFGLQLTKPQWLDIAVPATAPRVFEGILAIAIVCFLFLFALHVWKDIQRLREMRALQKHLSIVQWINFIIVDLLIPLVLGGFALSRITGELSFMFKNMYGI